MAEALGKDPLAYAKERDGFLQVLEHFHESRGTPFRRPPTLGGQEIDLYLLYSLVTQQGGWIKVNSKNSWKDLLHYFKIPGHCVNGSVALKQIYLRYLDRWEKTHFLGDENDRNNDEDEENRHKRWSARTLHAVSYIYNYTQHVIADANREYNHLSTDLYKASDYDRLALSLISPLPNEQDFAINVCTLLSNDGKHTLKLEKHPRIINFLLGHAGIFHHSSLRRLIIHHYKEVRKQPIHRFWEDVLESKEFLDLTNEDKFVKVEQKQVPKISIVGDDDSLIRDDLNANAILGLTEPMEVEGEKRDEDMCDSDNDSDVVSVSSECRTKYDAADDELFCLKRTLGTQDYIGQRVLQIATILRNLSFIEENVAVLVKNNHFVRFLLLCASSRWSLLRNLGLDMMGNLATDFVVKDLNSDLLANKMIKIVTKGLMSEDRAACISALEVLNKLSQNEVNEEALLKYLESNVYEKVCSFLTIHDVMLLIYTLECLYSLSSLGERACNFIVGNHGVVDTLVSLVTVEGKSYGPKACIGMKLVETLPSGVNVQQTQQSQVHVATSAANSTNSSGSPVQKVAAQTTPMRAVQIAPQRLIAITPSVTPTSHVVTLNTTSQATTATTMTPQQMMQQQHAHQQTIHENEQFALAWLRATYEPCVSGKIEQQELYKHYMNSCTKIGRKGVIAPLHFPRCVRSVFGGTVGPNPMKPNQPNEPQYYEGIKVRAQPLVINIQQSPIQTTNQAAGSPNRAASKRRVSPAKSPVGLTVAAEASADSTPVSPASPILKAQLSAPPKQRDTASTPITSKADVKSQVMAHPHLSQALLGTGSASTSNSTPGSSKDVQASQSNTSLIKSLLATKVNDCMAPASMKTATDCQNVAQVAQRQQQQRLLAQQSTPSSDNQKPKNDTPKSSRVNGARQLFNDSEVGDPAVSSTTQFGSTLKGKREPPQPPPPPLAPLSNNSTKTKTIKIDNEDSDSTGNNSLSSSTGVGTIGIGCVSSTEDGENSLTSFEELLNGVPNMDNPINEDSNSKDSVKGARNEITMDKPLRLADLLEKKIEKSPPPLLNGVLGKELRLGDKTLDLVENHIEKALSSCETDQVKEKEEEELKEGVEEGEKPNLKRPASDDIVESEPKKCMLSVNGSGNADSPAPDSVTSSNGEEGPATVSTAAAKLFADIAADILEDEDEEQLLQEAQQPVAAPSVPAVAETAPAAPTGQQNVQQIIVDNQQQVLLQPRQIIVSQAQMQSTNQVVISSGGQLKTQGTVIVQSAPQQRNQMVIQQSNTGQFLLSSGLSGQMQLVASGQPGQYVLQTSNAQGTYMVAQPQAAMVHGQPQTVLVAQTSQQQGTPTKTIIILQQQPANSTATHHQKVVVTPQGQPVVVIKSMASAGVTQTTTTTSSSNGVAVTEKKDEVKMPPKPRILRDLTTPFVCEWGECNIATKFKSANEVYLHVCEAHCPTGSEEIMCQWDRCDNMKRKRYSLMTHLHDKHCNTEAMKQSLARRKQNQQGGGKPESPTPTSTTPHPGYAPDAALHAIKRHALEFVNPKELQTKSSKPGGAALSAIAASRAGSSANDQDDNEGPVTKSIRLTASLILRNLVIYSTNCRRYLKHYEPHLANVALSNVESSRTIAQVLYDMNEGSNLR